MQDSSKKLSIIGAGRVGKSIARLVSEKTALSIGVVINRTMAKAEESVGFIGAGTPASYGKNLQDAYTDLVLISTPDEQIADTAAKLARTDVSLQGKMFFHCSGSLSSAALLPLKEKGANIASVHPLKSFSSPDDAVQSFSGTYCAIEGDDPAVAKLSDLFTQLGGVVISIDTESKVLYHSAAVLTCNYLYALIDIGLDIYQQLDIPAEMATKLLAPLLQGTLSNALQQGPRAALTGPIARGEEVVVQKQIEALRKLNPLYADVYATLGEVTADMALDSKSITKHTRERILQALSEN